MLRLLCIIAAGCLLVTACEKKTETAPQTGVKAPETATTPAPPAAPAAPTAQAPPGQPPAPGAEANLPGIQEVKYPIDLEAGARVYQQVCATCHQEGIAGAPKQGDREVWKPRIAKGMPTLVQNSIQGYQGNQGVMPPKGGAASLSDAEVASAAIYMAVQGSEAAPAAK